MKEICTSCGNPITSVDVFCTGCGKKIVRTTAAHTHSPTPDIKNEPLSIGKCLLGMILLAIPLVNIICLLVWAFSSASNTNVKNVARALLIAGVVSILMLVFGLTQFCFELSTIFHDTPVYTEETTPDIPWKHLDIPFDVSYL